MFSAAVTAVFLALVGFAMIIIACALFIRASTEDDIDHKYVFSLLIYGSMVIVGLLLIGAAIGVQIPTA
jgi:uncharacterized membrane protein